MRTELVEIYSDASNAAVLRHPDRRYPGCLVQGDTLHSWVQSLRSVQREAISLNEDAAAELRELEQSLGALLANYRSVLLAHNVDLPFHEAPAA